MRRSDCFLYSSNRIDKDDSRRALSSAKLDIDNLIGVKSLDIACVKNHNGGIYSERVIFPEIG
jgi:hypothetical protein